MDEQQLTPQQAENKVAALENRVGELDHQLIGLLSRRFKATDAVGLHKAENGLPLFVPGREQVIYDKLDKIAEEMGLSSDMLKAIWKETMDESKSRQAAIETQYKKEHGEHPRV